MPGDWTLGLEQPTCGIDNKPCWSTHAHCDTCKEKKKRENSVKELNIVLSFGRDNITSLDLVRVWHSVGWFTGSATTPERLLEAVHKSDIAVSAWDGDNLVGMCMTITNGLQVYITHCVVHDAYQGYDVGSRMLEMVKSRYKNHEILVDTSKAKVFYEKCGFEVSERDTMRLDTRHS